MVTMVVPMPVNNPKKEKVMIVAYIRILVVLAAMAFLAACDGKNSVTGPTNPSVSAIRQIGASPQDGATLPFGRRTETTVRYEVTEEHRGTAIVSCLSVDGEAVVPYSCDGKAIRDWPIGLVTTRPYLGNKLLGDKVQTNFIIHMLVPVGEISPPFGPFTPYAREVVRWTWHWE